MSGRSRTSRPGRLVAVSVAGALLLAACGGSAADRGGPAAGSPDSASSADAAATAAASAAASASASGSAESPVERAPAEEVAASLPPEGRAVGQPGRGSYPDVVGVKLLSGGERRVDVTVTLASPYDSPERYADAWRVITPAGEVVGVRELTHDHADEQPFTRSLPGVEVPEGVEVLIVEGRDSENGWGGRRWQIPLP